MQPILKIDLTSRETSLYEIPLEWCYGNGVVLDFSHKKKGESIEVKDLREALKKIAPSPAGKW